MMSRRSLRYILLSYDDDDDDDDDLFDPLPVLSSPYNYSDGCIIFYRKQMYFRRNDRVKQINKFFCPSRE